MEFNNIYYVSSMFMGSKTWLAALGFLWKKMMDGACFYAIMEPL